MDDKISFAKDEIKYRLKMREVVETYGFTPNAAGFMSCPFHSEKTPSFKVNKNTYHCFGCGESGDAIAFVRKLFNLDFPTTIKKINDDFSLNLPVRSLLTQEEKRHIRFTNAIRKFKTVCAKNKVERTENEYWALLDEYVRLDDAKRKYKPASAKVDIDSRYIEAVTKLPKIEYELSRMEVQLWQQKKQNSL